MRDSVLSRDGGRSPNLLVRSDGLRAQRLAVFVLRARDCRAFPAYRKWYLRLRPGRRRVLRRRRDTATSRCNACGRRTLLRPSFRRRFFDDAGIVERISIIQRGADAWRVINVSRHASDGRCSDRGNRLADRSCVPRAAHAAAQPSGAHAPAPPTVRELEERFADRCTGLTARERQVCARAALGLSVEGTALDLDIGKTSVLTYRQRAYQRLRVTSPFELCALVTH